MGQNVDVVASTSTDEPAVITEDGNCKEEIQEASDSVEINELVEVGHQTNSSGSTSPNTPRRVIIPLGHPPLT